MSELASEQCVTEIVLGWVSLEWPKMGIVIACRDERDGEAI